MSYLDETARAIRARVPPHLLPDEERVDDLFRTYALLARVKGDEVTAEDVHDAWALWMGSQRGDHASIRPYAELDPSKRSQDLPFVEAIRTVARDFG